jgi:hypothetical protein
MWQRYTAAIPPIQKLFLQHNLTYYDILCKNEISFPFIVLYVAKFLPHILIFVFTGDDKLPETCTTN